MLPLCDKLTGIENDLLKTFPEVEKKTSVLINKSFYKSHCSQFFRFNKIEKKV